jgi:hypothetical protein
LTFISLSLFLRLNPLNISLPQNKGHSNLQASPPLFRTFIFSNKPNILIKVMEIINNQKVSF